MKRTRGWRRGLIALAWLGCVIGGIATAGQGEPESRAFPPWSGHANDPVQQRGLEFTVPEVDDLPDFHGNPIDPALSLFVGGNYFFAMAPLVAEFERQHPELRGRIYYETIPPGLLVEQIRNGGTITVGNMTWTVHADVYAAGQGGVQRLIEAGLAQGEAEPYVTNTLTIMVPRGNPAHIRSLADLGRPGVRLVMPNPAFEGIARQIKQSLARAGGEALVRRVYEDKVRSGETQLTHIHHRQSPMWLMLGRADAGVTWQSEALFQQEIGNPIEHVDIPAAQNATAIYSAVVLKSAPHPQAAQQWVEFLHSEAALKIFEHYGFRAYRAGAH